MKMLLGGTREKREVVKMFESKTEEFLLIEHLLFVGPYTNNKLFRDFPCGPVANTPCSQYRGSRFDHWLGN